jgi:hypothetical protein
VNEYDASGLSVVAPDGPNGASPPVTPSLPHGVTALHRVNVCAVPLLFCQVTLPPGGVVTALGRKQYVPLAVE